MKNNYSDEERDILLKIGKCIKDLRIKEGLSQEKLGYKSNLDRTYIGSVERGERNISIINLIKIAKALKQAPSYFLRNLQ